MIPLTRKTKLQLTSATASVTNSTTTNVLGPKEIQVRNVSQKKSQQLSQSFMSSLQRTHDTNQASPIVELKCDEKSTSSQDDFSKPETTNQSVSVIKVSPTNRMNQRFTQHLEQVKIPSVDLEDVLLERNQDQKRQFAPEFSQDAYKAMLSKEFAIGDYTTYPNAPSELS